MTIKITPIPTFNDNYIWILHNDKHAVVVDPGASAPVNQFLTEHQLTLTQILITHHHWDHVNGLEELQRQWHCITYAPSDKRIPGQVHVVQENDHIRINELDLQFKVIDTPGHTLTHICYYNEESLFCGDTLFSMGCGRMFEGTPEQYVSSLNKIKQLKPETQVYCTHEYTMDNIKFAQTIEPNNPALEVLKEQVAKQLKLNQCSLPVLLEQEFKLNPFLRTDQNKTRAAMSLLSGKKIDSDVSCFATLRSLKDQF